MARHKRPRCHRRWRGAAAHTARATLKWFPFCSQRCAADWAIEMLIVQSYCATCDEYDEYTDHGHTHGHTTVGWRSERWHVTPGLDEEGGK
jgi:hypothetical protein